MKGKQGELTTWQVEVEKRVAVAMGDLLPMDPPGLRSVQVRALISVMVEELDEADCRVARLEMRVRGLESLNAL